MQATENWLSLEEENEKPNRPYKSDESLYWEGTSLWLYDLEFGEDGQ
jgi:hypothetical protein